MGYSDRRTGAAFAINFIEGGDIPEWGGCENEQAAELSAKIDLLVFGSADSFCRVLVGRHGSNVKCRGNKFNSVKGIVSG